MRAVAYAAAWGAGHGAVLLVLGGALIALGIKLPSSIEGVFELFVAGMLMVLGVRAIRSSRAATEPGTSTKPPLVKSSLLIGMIHGLAGSGAVTAVAIASTSTPLGSLACLLLYACSTTLGMAVLAGAAGPVLARTAQSERVGRAIVLVAGAASLVLGIVWTVVGIAALTRAV